MTATKLEPWMPPVFPTTFRIRQRSPLVLSSFANANDTQIAMNFQAENYELAAAFETMALLNRSFPLSRAFN